MITTFKPCEQGENGGFSPNGQLAAAVGSSVVAVLTYIAWWLTAPSDVNVNGTQLCVALAVIGWLGCQIDSYLGACLRTGLHVQRRRQRFSHHGWRAPDVCLPVKPLTALFNGALAS